MEEEKVVSTVYGTLTMEVSIDIDQDEYAVIKRAVELLNSYNIQIDNLNLQNLDGDQVNLNVHNVEMEWQQVFTNELNKQNVTKEETLVTNK